MGYTLYIIIFRNNPTSGHGSIHTKGGGIIKIVAPIIHINGSLFADGESCYSTSNYSAGSGGSIYLSTSSIIINGIISANGGNGMNKNKINYGGGGGGRIAIYSNEYNIDFNKITTYNFIIIDMVELD